MKNKYIFFNALFFFSYAILLTIVQQVNAENEATTVNDENSFYEEAIGYYNGNIRPFNYKRMISCAQMASQAGSMEADFLLARLYMQGGRQECPADLREALNCLHKYASVDSTEKDVLLARLLMLQVNENLRHDIEARNEVWRLLKQAEEAGNDEALYLLSILTQRGIGCEADNTLALNLLQRSADLQNREAMRSLALVYLRDERPDEAIPLLTLAAEKGDAEALYQLGEIYVDRLHDVSADLGRGLSYVRESASRGYILAQLVLGKCLIEGIQGYRDNLEGWFWMREAAQNGSIKAMEYIRNNEYKTNMYSN